MTAASLTLADAARMKPRVTREVWCPKCKCLTLTSSKLCLWCDSKVREP